MSHLDHLMPEDVKGYDYGRDDYRADQADIANDEQAIRTPEPVTESVNDSLTALDRIRAEFKLPEVTLPALRKVIVTAHHPAILENTVEQAYLLGRLHQLQGIPDQSRDVP